MNWKGYRRSAIVSLCFLVMFSQFTWMGAQAQAEQADPKLVIPGWVIEAGIGLVGVTDSQAYEGLKSLRFEASTVAGQSRTDVRSEHVPVKAGQQYTVTASVYMEEMLKGGTFGVYITSYNESGTEVGDGGRVGLQPSAFKAGEWTPIAHTVTVPEGASTVRIRMYTGDPTSMIGYIDNVQFFEGAGESKIPVPLVNGGFESTGTTPDGNDPAPDPGAEEPVPPIEPVPLHLENGGFTAYTVPGWHFADDRGGPYVTDESAFTGSQSLKFVATSTSGTWTDVRTPLIPAESGATYRVNAHVKMDQMVNNSFVWYLHGYDSDRKDIGGGSKAFRAADFKQGEWVEISFETTLPANSQYLMLRMYTGEPTATIAYVDNIRITKISGGTETAIVHPNLDFEEKPTIHKWTLNGLGIWLSSQQRFEGTYSLHFDNRRNEQLSAVSDRIMVEAGKPYYASFRYLFSDPESKARILISYFDSGNAKIGEAVIDVNQDQSPGNWRSQAEELVVPAGAVFASLTIASNGTEPLNGYFDNVYLDKTRPDTLPEPGIYPEAPVNPSFEETLTEGGGIPGWTVTETHPNSTLAITDQRASEGSKSLHFFDNHNEAGLRVQSASIGVTPGLTYNASINSNIVYQSHRIVLELEFYNARDEAVGKETSLFNNLPLNVWTPLPISATAPEGAVYAKLYFYSGGISITEVYFDDLQWSAQVPEAELETNLGTPVSLGEPVKVPLAQGGLIGTTPSGDREVYVVANGSPGVFHVNDAETGVLKFKEVLERGDDTVWAMAIDAAGDVYFASESSRILYRYVPAEKKLHRIASIPSGDTKVWDLAATPEGKIYGGTWPGAEVFEYDTLTGAFRNYGRVHPVEQYVRGITATDTHIYAAIGSTKHLIRIDRVTGAKEELLIKGDPKYLEHTSGQSGFYSDVWIYGDRLFLQSGASIILVVDRSTLQIINSFSVNDQISPPSPVQPDLIYFKSEDELHTYNLASNEVVKVEGIPRLPDTPRMKSLQWLTLSQGEEAGQTVLAAVSQYSEYFIYNPQLNTLRFVPLEIESQAVSIQSLEISPDNKLYIGGYQRGLAIVDADTGQTGKSFGIFRQAEGIGFKGNVAYFGTYTGAEIYRYNPERPDNFGTSPLNNPGFIYKMPDQQDRPFVVESSGSHVFVGSAPGYGLLGGSLAIYDEARDHWESHRNVVQDQSIIGLAYRNGLLYGGTSVWGGQGGSPSQSEAKLFIWDVEKGELIDSFTPEIPGIDQSPKMIGSLSFSPHDGLLWGAVDGTIFAMDPVTKQVVKSKVILPSTYSSSKWRPHYLRWGNDGLLYTTLSRKLVVINPETLQHKVFNDLGNVSLMVIARDGSIYYGQDSKLYRIPLVKSNNAYLAELKVDGLQISGFSADQFSYTVRLERSVSVIPTVEAVSSSDRAVIHIRQADALLGEASVTVVAEDGRTTKTYTVKFEYVPVEDRPTSLEPIINPPVSEAARALTSALELIRSEGSEAGAVLEAVQNALNHAGTLNAALIRTDRSGRTLRASLPNGVLADHLQLYLETAADIRQALSDNGYSVLMPAAEQMLRIEVPLHETGVMLDLSVDELKGLEEHNIALDLQLGNVSFMLEPSLAAGLAADRMGKQLTFSATVPDESELGDAQTARRNQADDYAELEAAGDIYEFEIFAGDHFITAFEPAVKVTLPVSDPFLDRTGGELGVYHFDELANVWEYVGGSVSEDGAWITFNARHFSKYAVFHYFKTFSDIQGHWAQSAVELLAGRHITDGYDDNRFGPVDGVTRAQFAAWLVRALNLSPGADHAALFDDVDPGAWYALPVQAAVEAGLVHGANGLFRPGDYVTREEMAVMAVRALQYASDRGLYTAAEQSPSVEFDDMASVSVWAVNDIKAAASIGLIEGMGDGTFAPKSGAQRAQGAMIIMRFLKLLEG
ncbi:S-layer homology domain-containing protein [Paenibacillus abyssi]|uniref:SLH domain-containing protein n=1 Tax=Paenibacillus abyssi TaxID=1340531 RepID=A0A917CR42_9BACL|nr:S-layer homology domain-containing protein [Paenibacillus abyssi]GGF96110.1 hypothetical protein GCM10010916_11700 [Paenibacillus abyssi]